MRHAGVLRKRNEKRLQHARRLERPREGLVVEVVVATHRERVQNPGLDVVRVTLGQFSHRLLVRQRSGSMRRGGMITVENLEGGDVVAFASGAGTHLLGLLDSLSALGQLHTDRPAERILGRVHRQAPPGHGALGIQLCDLGERRLRRLPGERMIEGHGTVEFLLRLGRARHLELHLTELLLRRGASRERHGYKQTNHKDGHPGRQRMPHITHPFVPSSP